MNLGWGVTTPTHPNTNIKPATKPHTNTTQQQSQATHKHKPIQKPGHRSKTQARPPIHAADLKPRPPIKNRSKPIQKKSSLEQTHSKNIITRATGANPFKKIITGANPFKPIQKTSSPEPRSKPIQ